MNSKKLEKVSWYVNDLPLNIKLSFKKKTVKNYLEKAKQLNPLSKESVEDIIRIFNIQRINQEKEATGYELLTISIAVGYLLGRKIFCFPWLNNSEINKNKDTLINIKNYLTENGCIILIPTDLKENLKGLADEFVEIKTSEQKWEIQKNIKKILYKWGPFGAKTEDIMETDIFSNILMYITEYYVYRKLELGSYIYHTFINEYKLDFIRSKEDCLDLVNNITQANLDNSN